MRRRRGRHRLNLYRHPSHPRPIPLGVHRWRVNTGTLWWRTRVVKGERVHGVHHRGRLRQRCVSAGCHSGRVRCSLSLLFIYCSIPRVEIWLDCRLYYYRAVWAQSLSHGDTNHRIGEVMVVWGGWGLNVNWKGRPGHVVTLFWDDYRDVWTHGFSFRWEVGHPPCDALSVVFPVQKNYNCNAIYL